MAAEIHAVGLATGYRPAVFAVRSPLAASVGKVRGKLGVKAIRYTDNSGDRS